MYYQNEALRPKSIPGYCLKQFQADRLLKKKKQQKKMKKKKPEQFNQFIQYPIFPLLQLGRYISYILRNIRKFYLHFRYIVSSQNRYPLTSHTLNIDLTKNENRKSGGCERK